MSFRVSVIPGDGVGPEVFFASKKILSKLVESYGLKIEFIEVEAGDAALAKYGEAYLNRH